MNIHADHHQNNKYKAIIPFFNIKKIQKKIIYEYFILHHFIERMGIKKYWAMKIFIMRSDKINMKMWSWICHIATLKWLVKLYSKFDCNSHGTKNDQWLYMYIYYIYIIIYTYIKDISFLNMSDGENECFNHRMYCAFYHNYKPQ